MVIHIFIKFKFWYNEYIGNTNYNNIFFGMIVAPSIVDIEG
jgi:hypothetical protein